MPVYELDGLAAGQIIDGPAVVESATTTVLLRPGDRARVTASGWLDIDLGTPRVMRRMIHSLESFRILKD